MFYPNIFVLGIISLAKTTFNYNAGNKDMVSFRGNTPCRIMSKFTGENSNLWEIEIQGRRGYAPKKMLMEQKILIKTADLVEVGSEPIYDNSYQNNGDKEMSAIFESLEHNIKSIDELEETSEYTVHEDYSNTPGAKQVSSDSTDIENKNEKKNSQLIVDDFNHEKDHVGYNNSSERDLDDSDRQAEPSEILSKSEPLDEIYTSHTSQMVSSDIIEHTTPPPSFSEETDVFSDILSGKSTANGESQTSMEIQMTTKTASDPGATDVLGTNSKDDILIGGTMEDNPENIFALDASDYLTYSNRKTPNEDRSIDGFVPSDRTNVENNNKDTSNIQYSNRILIIGDNDSEMESITTTEIDTEKEKGNGLGEQLTQEISQEEKVVKLESKDLYSASDEAQMKEIDSNSCIEKEKSWYEKITKTTMITAASPRDIVDSHFKKTGSTSETCEKKCKESVSNQGPSYGLVK